MNRPMLWYDSWNKVDFAVSMGNGKMGENQKKKKKRSERRE